MSWPPPLPTYTGDIAGNVANSLGWLFETFTIPGMMTDEAGSQPKPRPPAPKPVVSDGAMDRVVITGYRDSETDGYDWMLGPVMAGVLVVVIVMISTRGK